MNADDALDAAEIRRYGCTVDLEIHATIDSTQTRARQRVLDGLRNPALIVADAQTAGRGQRNRVWQSPPGAALYGTLIWPTARSMAALSGLSLVVGLGVRAALAQLCVDARLKWPNDVWVEGRKLAGILIEVLADAPGRIALIGIGLNRRLPSTAAEQIDQPWVDLSQIMAQVPPRNVLFGVLMAHLARHLARFEQAGLTAFDEEWMAADALAGQPIWLQGSSGPIAGVAMGIDATGRLKVDVGGELRTVVAGEVSVRGGDAVSRAASARPASAQEACPAPADCQ